MTISSTKPPLLADLVWEGGLRFTASSNGQEWPLDGETRSAASPVQALAAALAGCMSADIVQILTRGRLPLVTMEAHLQGARADEDPRRFTSIRLHFVLTGDVPADRIERAIALSRETYCSVWHSLRQDLEFVTSFEVHPAQAS
jgi:putative redox protein